MKLGDSKELDYEKSQKTHNYFHRLVLPMPSELTFVFKISGKYVSL